MNKSTHRADVIEVKLEKHPAADSLSIAHNEGYTICCRTADWEGVKLAAHIQPESIVNIALPEFKFLDDGRGNTHHRVKAKKLRGIVSYGFLIPVDHLGVNPGDDVAPMLGIEHYDPEEKSSTGGQNTKAPVHFSKYDVDAFLKYHSLFIDGEDVVCTQKINGANCRIIYKDETIYVGSRNFWKVDTPDSLFWKAYRSDERIEKFVKDNPGSILFGEAYGAVGGFKYDCEPGQIKFAAFDIWKDGRWLNYDEFASFDIPKSPLIYRGPYNFETMKNLAITTKNMLGNPEQCNEGIVISPAQERIDPKYGRVKHKLINPVYLEKH